jgi:hypothetical protein
MKFPQLDPAKRKKIVYWAIGLFVFNFLIFDILPIFQRKPEWSEIAATITQVSQTTLPKQVGDTTLVEIRPSKPWEFTYRYIIDAESAQVARDPQTRETFASLLRKQLEDKYRDSTTNSMGLIRKLRITCIHRYEDGAGDFVIDIKIEPKVLETR